MGRRIRTGPKSVFLCILWRHHRTALAYDWIKAYGRIYKPLGFHEWLQGQRPTIDWGLAWNLTKEILKDHTSHSYMALLNAVYVPSGAEQAAWLFAGQHEKRPWFDTKYDLLRQPAHVHNLTAKQREDRERLKRFFHIEDDL